MSFSGVYANCILLDHSEKDLRGIVTKYIINITIIAVDLKMKSRNNFTYLEDCKTTCQRDPRKMYRFLKIGTFDNGQ